MNLRLVVENFMKVCQPSGLDLYSGFSNLRNMSSTEF